MALVKAKKGAYMMTSAMAFPRRHIGMFGVVKFCAGLVIGFGLAIYFLPILIAEKGLDSASIVAFSDSASRHICPEFAGARWAALGRWGDYGQCRPYLA